jgi:hypothetical protein
MREQRLRHRPVNDYKWKADISLRNRLANHAQNFASADPNV